MCVHYQVNRVFAMPRSASPSTPTPVPGRRIQTELSSTGNGVLACRTRRGRVLVEYNGESSLARTQDSHPHAPQTNHTFYFQWMKTA